MDEVGNQGAATFSVGRGIAVVLGAVLGVLALGGGVAAAFLGSSESVQAGDAEVSVAWGAKSALITSTRDITEVIAVVDGNPTRFERFGAPCVEVVGAVTTMWVSTDDGAGSRLDRPGDAALAEDAATTATVERCPIDGPAD